LGGTIAITSPNVTVHEKGYIQAGSQREGNAGSIILNVDTLNLTQGGLITAAAIGKGLGGDVKVQAQNIHFSGGSSLSASSFSKGNAGNIILNLADKLIMRDSFIETAATESDGGNIFISAQNYLYFINSKISTSVGTGFGGGGNIIMRPEFVVQDESPIIAEAYGGQGGNINITTTAIYQFPLASLSRISASSQFGVDGEVYINSPTVDMNAMLGLYSDYVKVQLPKKCRYKDISEINTFYVYPEHKIKMRTPEDFSE
jgi:hypothetical protein